MLCGNHGEERRRLFREKEAHRRQGQWHPVTLGNVGHHRLSDQRVIDALIHGERLTLVVDEILQHVRLSDAADNT